MKVNIIESAFKERRQSLSEFESKQFLRSHGLPTTREMEVQDREGLNSAIREIGFPLVIKGSSPQLTHKTERGLVRLGMRTEKEALEAYLAILHEMKGEGGRVLVQEMVTGKRELVVGLTRDLQFGPCVMFGLGGIFTEILHDVTFRVAPLKKRDAMEMMGEIKASKILGAVRGMPPADLDRLAEILVKVGEIGLEENRIKEIDLNPVILSGKDPILVDALVILDV
jgi:acetate---CoA ligase (ADP-forming) subunit beta